MVDVDNLLDAIVAAMRDNPALVSLTSGTSSISAYHHIYPKKISLFEEINRIAIGQVMIAWTGTTISGRSNGIEHQFSVYLRPANRIGTIFQAMRDGIVTASGQKFKLLEVDSHCHPVNITGLSARTVSLSDAMTLDYHEISLTVTERGADI